MRNCVSCFALTAILLLTPMLLSAQDVAGMTGTITDASGAVIPGTSVTLTNGHLGVKFTAITDTTGSYRFPNVPPAPGYSVVFAHAGFASLTISNVALSVGITRSQDAKLLAGATEQVTVSAANQEETINTTDATIGSNLDPEVLNELPVYDRSSGISTLFHLQPGVDLDSGSVTGARTDQSSVTVDGMDVNDLGAGTTFALVTHAPVDSVEEFRGVVAGLVPAIGTGSGGQFQLVTKSGTDSFHGNINEYNRNTDTEANPWHNNLIGLPRTPLIRNQFGGNIGGPIRKDKVFFFFDFDDSRIIQSSTSEPTVPLDSFRNGTLNYISNGVDSATTQTCSDGSRLNVNPQCIQTLSSTQVAALDPAGIGFNPGMLAVLNSRYPHANDYTAGDGVNTGGFAFTAPTPDYRTDYVARVDYNLTPKQRVFGRLTIGRENDYNTTPLFPGQPVYTGFYDRSYGYVISHEWQIGQNKVNQAYYGDTVSKFDFPFTNSTSPNLYSFTGLSSPYANGDAQQRRIPIPEVRDDFNWVAGQHNVNLGGTFKFIKTNSDLTYNYNFINVGQTGNQLYNGLDATVRPANIGKGQTALDDYDSLFTTALGVIGSTSANFDYNSAGVPFTQGSGAHRNYRFYETELYAADTWKVTPHLTLTYGLRYMLYSVPYETHGEESIPFLQGQSSNAGLSFGKYFASRVAQSSSGLSGNNAVPIISYELGGKANNGPNIYAPSYKDLAPRFALAYNPAWAPKTVFNLSAGLVYDRTVINAVNFIQDQSSYLFQDSATQQFGSSAGAAASLAVDPRIGANLSYSPSILPAAPKVGTPFTPFVDSTGTPYGLAEGSSFNYAVDPTLKDPYSIALNAGVQQELPNHLILRLNYSGRLGRRLLAQTDASQLIDNPDPVSGQLMSAAFAGLELQERAGANPSSATGLTAQPWFEHVAAPGLGQSLHYANNTSLIGALEGVLGPRGDMADMVETLALYDYYYGYPLLPTNVGMDSQFAENTFLTNKGFSSYNALLVTLDQNQSQGLQYGFNYTWSHSIDNTSLVANSIAAGGYGFFCDATRPRECRGNSDFDVQQEINAHFVYRLPIGRGQGFLGAAPLWLDEIIGGWAVSGIPNYRTGQTLNVFSDAFVAGYANDAPAIFIGQNKRDLRANVNKQNGSVFMFTNTAKAFSDFEGPIGLQIGQRNDFRGPGSFNFDAGLAKSFAILPSDRLNLKFRGDAFNVLNHPTYGEPGLNIASDNNFGQITGGPITYGPRVLQVSARLEF